MPVSGRSPRLAGQTVSQVLILANKVPGGTTSSLPAGLSVSDLNNVVTQFNQNLNNGAVDLDYLY